MRDIIRLVTLAVVLTAPAAARADEDTDGDGVGDDVDNCFYVPNPDQANTDGAGPGDACDADDDNDGVYDEQDTCPFDFDPDDADLDSDGLGDVCDGDRDGDTIIDEAEPLLGLDDGTPDTDGDTIGDATELLGSGPYAIDTDGDGTIDPLDLDSDDDGLPDADEAGDDDLATPPIDTDLDGVPDYREAVRLVPDLPPTPDPGAEPERTTPPPVPPATHGSTVVTDPPGARAAGDAVEGAFDLAAVNADPMEDDGPDAVEPAGCRVAAGDRGATAPLAAIGLLLAALFALRAISPRRRA